MKYPTLILAIGLGLVCNAYAQQVKRTYQDTNLQSTTVVVKENGVEDYDILDDNFDIEEYSVGQVIMIKTEADPNALTAKGIQKKDELVQETVVRRRYNFGSKVEVIETEENTQQLNTLPEQEKPEEQPITELQPVAINIPVSQTTPTTPAITPSVVEVEVQEETTEQKPVVQKSAATAQKMTGSSSSSVKKSSSSGKAYSYGKAKRLRKRSRGKSYGSKRIKIFKKRRSGKRIKCFKF